MFNSLRYLNAAGTIIAATRADGSERCIEPTDADLWAMAQAGKLGVVEAYEPPPLPPLDYVKAGAAGLINEIAGKVRARYITVIPGQEKVLEWKRQEAERYLQDSPKNLDGYAFLAAAVGVVAPDADAVVAIWMAKEQSDYELFADIEGNRETALKAVRAATTHADVDAEIAAYSTAMQAI